MKNEHAVIIIAGTAIVSFLIGITLNALMIPPQEFRGTPAYDSGWLDITDKTGQHFNIVHNLGSTDIIVDIIGKRKVDDEAHQRNLGGTDYTSDEGVRYGGVRMDIAYAMAPTADGGYALAGYTTSLSNATLNRDFWLVKIDANGDVQWNQTYGGDNNDDAHSLLQTSDRGYAIIGWTKSYGAGDADFWLVKTDSAGNVEWNQTYGGAGVDAAYSSVATSDGGYAMAGRMGGDSWLVKVDSSGNHEWNNTYGGAGDEYATSVVETSDGGYAMAGSSETWGLDFWLTKTDSSGNQQWTNTYGGENNEVANCIIQTNDAGYVLAGYTNSIGAGQYDFWLVKTDSIGNIVWAQTYGTAENEEARSVIAAPDGGYVVGGYTYPSGGGDFWVVKTDAFGDVFQYRFEYGLAWTDSTADTITLYRGTNDPYWNYVRVRIWKIRETP